MNENAFEKMMYAIQNYKLSWRKSQLHLHNLLFFCAYCSIFRDHTNARHSKNNRFPQKNRSNNRKNSDFFSTKKIKNNRHFHRDKSKKRQLIQSAQKADAFGHPPFALRVCAVPIHVGTAVWGKVRITMLAARLIRTAPGSPRAGALCRCPSRERSRTDRSQDRGQTRTCRRR